MYQPDPFQKYSFCVSKNKVRYTLVARAQTRTTTRALQSTHLRVVRSTGDGRGQKRAGRGAGEGGEVDGDGSKPERYDGQGLDDAGAGAGRGRRERGDPRAPARGAPSAERIGGGGMGDGRARGGLEG